MLLDATNSLNIDGYQIAIEADGGSLAKRVSSRQFAVPVGDRETYFWVVAKSWFNDASMKIALNGIQSSQAWVLSQHRIERFDHQAGGDRGRFCVMRRANNEGLADAYTAAGATGPLASVEFEFTPLLPAPSWMTDRPSDDVLRRSKGAARGGLGAERGLTRGPIMFGGPPSRPAYDEAIVATGSESDMKTQQVERKPDRSRPVISFGLEIVAAPESSVRIPNPYGGASAQIHWTH